MLKLEKCVIKQASTIKVDPEINILEEGVGLVRKMLNGEVVAALPTGDVDEVFIGYSQNRHTAPATAIGTKTFSIPSAAPYRVNLGRAIVGGELGVYIDGVIATKITTGTPTTGQVLYTTAGELTFAAADAGKIADTKWRYSLTQVEANLLFGTDLVSFVRLPEVATSLIEVGLVVTDRYELGDDWNNAVYAYLGEDGILTTDDSAGPKAGYVSLLPSAAEGFLGVEISV